MTKIEAKKEIKKIEDKLITLANKQRINQEFNQDLGKMLNEILTLCDSLYLIRKSL